MNPKYTELKADTLSNPFSKTKGSKMNELMRNKSGLTKYIIGILLIIGLIICSIILITKSSQLKQIAIEKENYERQIKEIQVSNEDLLRNIKEIEESVNRLTKEKNDLVKEENELKKKKEELVQQNTINYDQEIQMLQDQLEAATKKYDQMKKDNPNVDKDKTELEEIVKKYRAELTSLQEEYDRLKTQLSPRLLQTLPYQDNINSNILTQSQRERILKWFDSPIQFKNLLYQATTSNFNPEDFHLEVGNERNTLVVLLTNDNNIIGGFTSQSWSGEGFKEDPKAFLFNLSQQKLFPILSAENAIYCSSQLFPTFGNDDLTINKANIQSKFPISYQGNQLELTNGQDTLYLNQLEVFSLSEHF